MSIAPDSCSIRSAVESDLDVLVDFRLRLFQELGEGPDASLIEAFNAACRQALLRCFRAGTCLSWVAEGSAGGCVGTLVMLLFPRIPSPKISAATEGYILNVYVVPEWRRKGIAAALSAAALERAQAMGLARVRLHASPAGRAAYLHAGFHPRQDEMEFVLQPGDTA